MAAPDVSIASRADRPRVIESLVAAFAEDPVLRHLFPDESTYPDYAAAFFGHLFDKRVHRGTVWTVEHGASVAIWEPPTAAEESPVDPYVRIPADALRRVHAYEQAVHALLPAVPFWYLGVLGTHPRYAGRRWGHAVMAAGLDRASHDRLPAILETSNPANVEVYRRAGWEVVRSVRHPLPIWLMQRTPH